MSEQAMTKNTDLERWTARMITRRQVLKAGLFGAAGLLLCDRLLPRVLAGTANGPAVRPAKARAVIQVWLVQHIQNGGFEIILLGR